MSVATTHPIAFGLTMFLAGQMTLLLVLGLCQRAASRAATDEPGIELDLHEHPRRPTTVHTAA